MNSYQIAIVVTGSLLQGGEWGHGSGRPWGTAILLGCLLKASLAWQVSPLVLSLWASGISFWGLWFWRFDFKKKNTHAHKQLDNTHTKQGIFLCNVELGVFFYLQNQNDIWGTCEQKGVFKLKKNWCWREPGGSILCTVSDGSICRSI